MDPQARPNTRRPLRPNLPRMRRYTGELIYAEQLPLSDTNSDTLLTTLENKPMSEISPNIVTYFGHQKLGHHIYLLTEHCSSGTLREFITTNPNVNVTRVKQFLREILSGLVQAEEQDIAAQSVDSKYIFLDHLGVAKISPPILAIEPAEELTLPDIGVVTQELLTGDSSISLDDEARDFLIRCVEKRTGIAVSIFPRV